MYGDNYGYMSSLNPTMVQHLKTKAEKLQAQIDLIPGEVVLDIGSNDGTFLSFFKKTNIRIGIDPTILKFRINYKKDIITIPDYNYYS
jgi:NDP-4-keto-2,6-dideoxyhexose 3-C-methyltransferase